MHARIADLIAILARQGAHVSFPGRVRLLCDDLVAGLLPEGLRDQREWPGAAGATLLAAAIGAAWAEHRRGGLVVAVCRPSGPADRRFWEAAELAGRLPCPGLLLLLPGGQDDDLDRLEACGWRRAIDAGQGAGAVPTAGLMTAGGLLPAPDIASDRNQQPVHLESLPHGGLPPWPVGDGEPPAACDRWLGWLMEREPRLLAPQLVPPWSRLAVTPSTLIALAQLAGEGRRVCLRVPGGTPLDDWLEMLGEVGRRGLALKLLVEQRDLPALDRLHPLVGWWVVAPADLAEAAAVVALALHDEHTTLIVLPSAGHGRSGLPDGGAHVPGTGREIAPGRGLTLVCDQEGLALAQAARHALADQGTEAGIFFCTSLMPLPLAQLEACARQAPLVVCAHQAHAPALAAGIDRHLARVGLRERVAGVHSPGGPAGLAALVSSAAALVSSRASPDSGRG